MNKAQVKVLVVAHKFPPFSGVGANRWTHLSKCLAEQGFNLSVLTVWRGRVSTTSNHLDIHFIQKFGFYRFLNTKFKSKIVSGVFARFVELIRKIFWYDDEAQFLGESLEVAIKKFLSKHKKIVLIATGHPFQINRWAAEIKRKYSDQIILIQDFRDPWADNPFKKYLFDFQLRKVKEWQEKALRYSDENVYVTNGLKNLMETQAKKGTVIENGHPFTSINSAIKKGNYIIHAGTLANGRDVIAEPFFQLCAENPKILGGRQVIFYGRISFWLLEKYRLLFREDLFVTKGVVAQEELKSAYLGADFALQFNSKEYPYLVSTKIYEHAALGLATLSINGGGEIEHLIEKHRIGESTRADRDSIKKALKLVDQRDYSDSLNKFANMSSFKNRSFQYSELIMQLYTESL